MIDVIVNAGSGAGAGAEIKNKLTKAFAAEKLDVRVLVAQKGSQLPELANRAAQGEAQIIVAAGGDGTIGTVAAALVGTKKTLGVLPLGTLNHFSKDLRIPQDLAEAVRVIAENHTTEIDVGEVNGRIFINNSSIGLYPRIVRRRERQQQIGKSKWYAAFWAAVSVFRRYPFLNVRLRFERKLIERETPFVFVGNNEYELHSFNIGGRQNLADGLLSVYVLHRTGRLGLTLLALRSIFGILREAEDFDEYLTDEITIQTRRKRLLVARDGEVEVMQSPLKYRIRPKELRVIVPTENNQS